MFRQHVFILLVALPFLADAFGPATPLKFSQKNHATTTMRIGTGDMTRRSKITYMLDHVVIPGNPTATKEAIETTVMTETMVETLETMNWRNRKSMIRKVRKLALAYDVPIEKSFGIPLPRLELEAIASKEATVKREARKVHFDKVNADRIVAVAARRASEAGSDADKAKKAAIRASKLEAMDAEAEAKKAAVEIEAKAKYDATLANEAAAKQENDAAAAAAAEIADKKNKASQNKDLR